MFISFQIFLETIFLSSCPLRNLTIFHCSPRHTHKLLPVEQEESHPKLSAFCCHKRRTMVQVRKFFAALFSEIFASKSNWSDYCFAIIMCNGLWVCESVFSPLWLRKIIDGNCFLIAGYFPELFVFEIMRWGKLFNRVFFKDFVMKVMIKICFNKSIYW